MTQINKCDVCRSRKVKCDQGKPACRNCLDRGRPCSYRYLEKADPNKRQKKDSDRFNTSSLADTDSDAGLRLKSSRRATTGNGVFQTFTSHGVTQNDPQPPVSLSSKTTFIVAKWMRMSIRMPDRFAEGLVTRFGDDAALDAVAEYTSDCHYLFETQTERSTEITRKSGVKAFKALRAAVAESDPDVSETLLTSVRLLLIAEYLRGVDSGHYKYHASALSQMLKARFTSGKRKWGWTEELLVRTIYIEEAGDSIFANVVSDLDDEKRIQVRDLAMKPRSPLEATIIWVTDNSYRVPRLVKLIRALRETPDDRSLLLSILVLAYSIYDPEPMENFRKLVEEAEPSIEAATNPLGKSIAYANDEQFGLAVWYYHYRLHICGVIQRIFEVVDISLLPAVHQHFDLAAVEAEEIKAAEQLAMSTAYALRPTLLHPFLALRLLTPFSATYGTWSRLEKRAIGIDYPMAAHAASMKEFVYETIIRITDTLRTSPPQRDFCASVNDAYFGGPAMPWVSWRSKKFNNGSPSQDTPRAY